MQLTVRSARLTFQIPYAASLKDKRQVKRSIIDRVSRRFNVSIAEVDAQDYHQTLVLGIALVSGDGAHAQDELNTVLRFLSETEDAELMSIEEE